MASDFELDFDLAQRLGFLHFALGGSRAYTNTDVSQRRDRDWDFVAVVQTHSDILSVVLRCTTQLEDLLGITQAEDVSWQVGRKALVQFIKG
ncbi:hypothetical protein ColLi_10929 [Colletotrichum liriopes]|uniref:Uncharacterized protein n=1 Tax=Colletotrichum liriopes TaxID=708192 RepID=A0AA37LXW5_9PEZI|nr:hypothetical protein ColLi_10929 [Colletotrichum liriopes]